MNKLIPMSVLLISLVIIFSASSWFTAWMGLEVNMMSFLPLVINHNKLSSEAAMKYFFTQAVGSMLLFLFMLMMFSYSSMIYFDLSSYSVNMMLNLALMLKIGAAPLHFWLPSIVEGLKWETVMILITLQKFGPLSLIALSATKSTFMLVSFAMTSSVVGALSGLNQLLCRKLMVYSSIAHLGWMIFASTLFKSLMLIYFMFYSFITGAVIVIFKSYNAFHMNQTYLFHNTMLMFSLTFYISLLSLGGLPPLLGFFPKWLVVKYSMTNITSMVVFVLVMSSVITMYFYMRLTYTAMMFMFFKSSMSNTNQMMTSTMKFLILFPTLFFPIMVIAA